MATSTLALALERRAWSLAAPCLLLGVAEAAADLPPDTLMKPESVGEAYWQLHNQPRDAWTFEMDLRPYAEKW